MEKNTNNKSAFGRLIKEFRRIEWPGWAEDRINHKPGILPTFVKVVCFTAVFVGFFMVCDLGLALLFQSFGL